MSKKKGKTATVSTEKIVQHAFQKLDEIEGRNFETARVLSEYSLFDMARKVIVENLRKDYDDVGFILCISKYLFLSNINLIEQNQIETHKTIIRETKAFVKYIKKSLKRIEESFDETYLLYARNVGEFYAIDNVKLVCSFEELLQILNLTNYNREAEIAFELKSKLELGFERYFLHEKGNSILSFFDSKGNYRVANDIEIMEIINYSDLDIKPKTDFKTNNFVNILANMNYLKKFDKAELVKTLKKYAKMIDFFPLEIYGVDEYDRRVGIAKSINRNFEEEAIRLVKKKLVLVKPYDVDSYNLVLKILK